MEEFTEEAQVVGDSNKADVNQNDTIAAKDNSVNEATNGAAEVTAGENGPSQGPSSEAADNGNQNVVESVVGDGTETAIASNSNDESQKQADIPRNTPPPDYVQETVSNNAEGVNGKTGGGGLAASPDNFWLVGNYKKVVKKIEDGSKLCDEISQMVLERAEIESLYAKKLKAWNKKWGQTLSKELEYGTVLQSLLGGLAESNDIADIHLAVQGKLSEVSSQLLQWKSETYHKGIIGIKESKKAEEGFSKGQKPWAKKFDDSIKGRQNYHSACQMLDLANAQEEELKAARDTTTQEQLTKAAAKVKKATQDKENALEIYKESLRDIGGYNQKYKDDMVYEYDKWQTAEGRRKDFVIEKMKQYKNCIDLSQFHTRIEKIYSKMSDVYDVANTVNDLEFFRRNYGPDVPFIDLSFIEYNPEVHTTAKAKAKEPTQPAVTNSNGKPKEKSKVCVAL